MHMADALVSPMVGGTMWAVSAGLIGYCSSRVKHNIDDRTVPLMGVLGAFVFAAQMINFAIPATGSSGHLGGGLLLAILLGPSAAFLTLASILTIQALFFADGGILALGCNIFNLGFFPCMIAYPFLYKPLAPTGSTPTRIVTASLVSAIFGLQMGSLGVVFQTLLSGITDLPFQAFLLFMQPVHLAIGIVEGLATASVIVFISKTRPDIFNAAHAEFQPRLPMRKALLLFFGVALFSGCLLSPFASSQPDGLEWSLFKTAGTEEQAEPGGSLHTLLADVQAKTALLPDYGFRQEAGNSPSRETSFFFSPADESTGTSFSGLIGSILTLVIASLLGFLLKRANVPVKNR